VNFEKLENAEHYVVDVAEAGGLGLLGVVEAAGPVEGDVGVSTVELDGGADGSAGGGLAETEEAVEDWTVLADIEALEVAREDRVGKGHRRDGGQEVHVIQRVEPPDIGGPRRKRPVDLHPTVEPVVDDEVVGHPDPVGLHRMPLPVVVIPYARLVEVAHSPFLRVWPRWQRRALYAIGHNHHLSALSLSVLTRGSEIVQQYR
jgi:hypothetical protein